MNKQDLIKRLSPIILLGLTIAFSHSIFSQKPEPVNILNTFLKQTATWKGVMENWVNRKGGITQEGRVHFEVKYDKKDQIVTFKIRLFDPNNKQTGYTGYATMKIEGNRLTYVGDTSKDENTGNKIENHVFIGFITDKHIYILEEYVEVLPDGKKEKRRNSTHHVLINRDKILTTADVYLNGKLLVFANTVLYREKPYVSR